MSGLAISLSTATQMKEMHLREDITEISSLSHGFMEVTERTMAQTDKEN